MQKLLTIRQEAAFGGLQILQPGVSVSKARQTLEHVRRPVTNLKVWKLFSLLIGNRRRGSLKSDSFFDFPFQTLVYSRT